MDRRVMKKSLRLLFVFVLFGLSACAQDKGINTISEQGDMSSPVYMAVFGDIQYLTNTDNINVYEHSLNWLRSKVDEGWHLNCILQTGDITNNNRINQWESFYQATTPIAYQIPYYSMIGNHDYTWGENNKINDRNETHFNEYVQFPLSLQKVVAWYEKGRMENIVVENIIYGQRLDLLILEFGPRVEVVEWADAYVKAHPDHYFILMNHEYLEKGGGRRTSGITARAQFVGDSVVSPEQLWNNLIKCNDNIRVVLCGHVGGLYALTIDTNDYGREIAQIQHNIQGSDYRYDNWLMLWEFPAESDSANVCIYNTKTGQYYNDQQCLFKFKYRETLHVSRFCSVSSSSTNRLLYDVNGIVSETNNRGIRILKDGEKTVKVVY